MNLPEGGLSVSGHLSDALLVAHIQLERKHAAAEGLDLGFKIGQGVARATGDDKIGAGLCQRASEILPQPTAGAGDDRDLPVQIKKFVTHALEIKKCSIKHLDRLPKGELSRPRVDLIEASRRTRGSASKSLSLGSAPVHAAAQTTVARLQAERSH